MRYRRLLLLLLIPAQLLGLIALIWFDNEANRGVTFAPDGPPVPWADVPQIGVNLFNIQFEPDPANVRRTLTLARTMGAGVIRMQMPWEDVEIAGKGDFADRRNPQHIRSSWEKYDTIMAEARRLDLKVLLRIDRPPRWARTQADATPAFQSGLAENPDSTGPPDVYADYADFVALVVARYRGTVRFVQIWNEPNLAYEWNWRLPEPERFVELLRLAATAARAANPEVQIVFPSLSPTDGKEPRIAPLSELEFLDRVYRAGGAPFFDIMSAQAYGLGQPPEENRYVRLRWDVRQPFKDLDRPIDSRIDVSRVVMLREVMLRYGDASKAVWISEFGYNSAPESVPEPARSTWGPPVSEEQKAEYIVRQMERARREWPWMGVMNIWFLRWGGEPPDPANPTAYFAVVAHDFTPLPAYERVRAYAARGDMAGPGAHTWQHPAVTPLEPGAWQLRFYGQSLDLGQLPQPGTAQLPDGSSVSLAAGARVAVVHGLPTDVHTVIIRAPMPPLAFEVARERPWDWFWTLAPALLILSLCANCAALFMAVWRR